MKLESELVPCDIFRELLIKIHSKMGRKIKIDKSWHKAFYRVQELYPKEMECFDFLVRTSPFTRDIDRCKLMYYQTGDLRFVSTIKDNWIEIDNLNRLKSYNEMLSTEDKQKLEEISNKIYNLISNQP